MNAHPSLYVALCSEEHLYEAWKIVKSKGSAGDIDGITLSCFEMQFLNGLPRQYVPKEIPLEYVIYNYLEKVTEKLNSRPRKRLGFMTPREAKSFKSVKQLKRILKC